MRIVPFLVAIVEASTPTRRAESFESDTFVYNVIRKLDSMDGSRTYLVDAVDRATRVQNGVRVLICDRAGNSIGQAFERIQLARHTGFAPSVSEIFDQPSTGRECMAMEQYAENLPTYIDFIRQPIPEATLGHIGMRMLEVTRGLHNSDLGNREAFASRWVLKQAGDIASMIMVGYYSMRRISEHDPWGTHRILELQQLALTLRYLVDFDKRWYSIRALPTRDINAICEYGTKCPPGLEALIRFVLGVNPEEGALPRYMYERMRSLIHDMIESKHYSLPDVGMSEVIPRPWAVPFYEEATQRPTFMHGSFRVTLRYRMGLGTSGDVYDAITTDPTVKWGQLALKCRASVETEFEWMRQLQTAPWCPKLYGNIIDYNTHDPPLKCIAMEKVHLNLQQIARTRELLDFKELIQVANSMFRVIRSLHTDFQLVHGNIHPQHWAMRTDANNLVLFDYSHASSVLEDRDGRKRLRDLRQVIESVGHLWGMKERLLQADITHEADMTHESQVCFDLLRYLTTYFSMVHNSAVIDMVHVYEIVEIVSQNLEQALINVR